MTTMQQFWTGLIISILNLDLNKHDGKRLHLPNLQQEVEQDGPLIIIEFAIRIHKGYGDVNFVLVFSGHTVQKVSTIFFPFLLQVCMAVMKPKQRSAVKKSCSSLRSEAEFAYTAISGYLHRQSITVDSCTQLAI